jgi:hypothetical protein
MGCQPCEAFQPAAPAGVLNGQLWIDTSSGPPYQLKVWNQAAGAWQAVGIVSPSPTGGGAVSLIQTVTLGAAAPSITLTPAGAFTHLRILAQLRGTQAATAVNLQGRLNGDAVGPYDYQQIAGQAGGVQAGRAGGNTSLTLGQIMAANGSAGSASPFSMDIPNWAGTVFRKQTLSWCGQADAASGTFGDFGYANEWRNTAAINSIQLLPAAGSFAAGCVASLYGLA